MIRELWTILDSDGVQITFDSFLEIDVRNEGKILTQPVEEGGYATYNKVQSPYDIRVSLARGGDSTDIETLLATLERYQREPVVLSIVSPGAVYDSMGLESFVYRRTRDNGVSLLTVDLTFVEVRTVETQITTTVVTKPKNPTSANPNNTGKTQTDDGKVTSILEDIL